MNLKRLAADYAVQQVSSGMALGLGSGSTMAYVIEALGQLLAAGTLERMVGVPTSEATARQASQAGIPLTTLEDHPQLDLAIDGADEVDPDLNLIKGLGGALLREKLVALAARRVLIVVDESKRVDRLGSKAPLPVEVLPFGWSLHLPLLERLGATAQLRTDGPGQPYVTDNGNYILHCAFDEAIPDAYIVAEALDTQTGIIEHGLFLAVATEVCVATAEGIEQLTRGPRGAVQ